MKVNPRWQAGWLQIGYDSGLLTEEAKKELNQMKKDHPKWNFNQLAEDVKLKKIGPRIL